MKLITWNVNGIRSVQKHGFLDWFAQESPDILCLQEIKATPDQLDFFMLNPKGYTSYWAPAKKPGYSGVAIYSKVEPLAVRIGMDWAPAEEEGRVLELEYKDFVFVGAYFPNSQRDHARLPFKLDFCAQMLKACERIRKTGKGVVLCGDFNIAHRAIDLRNPKTNEKNAGFLPEERAWMDQFIEKSGYVDCFRKFNAGGGHYTWWSYRPGVREKNIGWRLDYFCVNSEFEQRLKSCEIQSQVLGSDHCPVVLELQD